MKLPSGGIDIFYIDESGDSDVLAMSCVSVPFLRNISGAWTIVWEHHHDAIKEWRSKARQHVHIPVRKELKGSLLASGRSRYKYGKHQFGREEAADVYRRLLRNIWFLQNASIMSATGGRGAYLYDHGRLEALLYALLQRMRTACDKSNRAGMVFFDEGHGEYRKLYRQARVYLPTGSSWGGWADGTMAKNLPLDNFVKDGNFKDSRHSHYIQLADLIAYAAYMKVKSEETFLTPWQKANDLDMLYDSIPKAQLNLKATADDPVNGIIRVK